LKRNIDLIKYSPEQYYLQMMEEYGITLNYIPLKDIASYLGITPQALSRIRKRIF
jgi:CRP/FNR family transcriptional regulator, anaerobic regulatory protein